MKKSKLNEYKHEYKQIHKSHFCMTNSRFLEAALISYPSRQYFQHVQILRKWQLAFEVWQGVWPLAGQHV
jgi:hypothetical protein